MITITLTEEQEAILLRIFSGIPNPAGAELPHEDKISLAFDTLLSSVDTTMDAVTEATELGEPIDARQLKRALKEVLNPDISTSFTPPKEVPVTAIKKLSFEEIAAKVPDNQYVKEAIELNDPICKQAIEDVFSQLAEDQWDNEDTAELLFEREGQLDSDAAAFSEGEDSEGESKD